MYEKNKYAERRKFEQMEQAANQGDAEAQNNLGSEYFFEAMGTHQNYDKAFKWFTKAANQGNASSQYMLGLMYYDGRGVRQDYDRAVELFTKAANQDYSLS